jgi:hypothetical protein
VNIYIRVRRSWLEVVAALAVLALICLFAFVYTTRPRERVLPSVCGESGDITSPAVVVAKCLPLEPRAWPTPDLMQPVLTPR